jgi:hypothetical protein
VAVAFDCVLSRCAHRCTGISIASPVEVVWWSWSSTIVPHTGGCAPPNMLSANRGEAPLTSAQYAAAVADSPYDKHTILRGLPPCPPDSVINRVCPDVLCLHSCPRPSTRMQEKGAPAA